MARRGCLRRFCLLKILQSLVLSLCLSSTISSLVPVARPAARSLLHLREVVEPNTEFVVDREGTVSLRDKSGELLWSFASGSPVHSSYQAPTNATDTTATTSTPFFMAYLDASESNDARDPRYFTWKFPMTLEDFLKNMPFVSDHGVTLGSKTTIAFLLDGRSGRVIHVYKSPESPPGDHNSTSAMVKPTAEDDVELPLLITRTDSKLQHFDKSSGKLSWNMSVAHFTAALLCEPTFTSAQELGPEIQTGFNMPLLCGSQTDIRWLVKSELFVKALLFQPLSLPFQLLSKVENRNETRKLPASVPDHTLPSQSRVDKLSNSSQHNESKASLSLPHLRTTDSGREHVTDAQRLYDDALSVLFEWPALVSHILLFIVLFSAGIYCVVRSIIYFHAFVAKQQFFWRGLTGDFNLKAANSKRRKNRKSGKDKHASPGSGDGFEFMEGGNEMLLNISNLLSDAADGRKVGKLSVLSKEIAKGSNGTVIFEGIYEGRPVAVKRLVRSHHQVAFKEIQNLIASDQHPNIVRWYGVEQDRDFVYLSLERCTCSLDDLIQTYSYSLGNEAFNTSQAKKARAVFKIRQDSYKSLTQDLELWEASGHPSLLLLRLMRDIVSGLAHLHELGIIHRDLKPQNVLITEGRTLIAKLSDMGISKRLPGGMSSLGHLATGCGSSGWQAPEQLLSGRQTRAVDMYSLGCVLFFCITGGEHPFGAPLERDVNIVRNKMNLFLVEHIPEAFDLISSLLNPDPELRPNAREVLLHPLFWSSEMRLSFLRDASDRVELENREADSDILKALESTAPVALGGKWDEKLDSAFITNIGHYRRYKYDSVRDLLRVIRNKLNHYRELPKEIQELVGTVPEGFDAYFASRFPKLLIQVYRVVHKHCKVEELFQKYFRSNIA